MSCASEKFPENCNIPDVKIFQYSRKCPENARRVDVSASGILQFSGHFSDAQDIYRMHPDVFDDNFRTFFFYRGLHDSKLLLSDIPFPTHLIQRIQVLPNMDSLLKVSKFS